MKKLRDCEVPNCIPTPSGCVQWNGGDISSLGICDGDFLNTLIWEIVKKLESIAGEDLSQFDIDGLLSLCNVKAPQEVTLLSILNVVKANQVCLKDYVDGLSIQLAALLNTSKTNVDLKCYQEFDNVGNALSLTRDELDQLVINKLCAHELSIDTLNGKVINLQEQINDLNNTQNVEELSFATCVDSAVKPTSSQVIAIANAHCDLQAATGTSAQIQSALSKIPSGWNAKYGTQPGWIASPSNEAHVINNILIVIGLIGGDVTFMQENCCAMSCDDVKLGFSAVYNEDMDGMVMKFTSGAGTTIPSGFTDKGSTGTIKDQNGNVETFNLVITNNYQIEVPITGLDVTGDIQINISAKLGTDSLTCEKCLNKTVKNSGCAYCEITATGEAGASIVLIYDDNNVVGSVIQAPSTTTTTTSSGG